MNKKPTIADVARASGVSRSTAARAMSRKGYVDEDKRKLIEATAARLGYRGSAIARALRTHRSQTVGILVADITNPIFPMIVKGADEVLTEQGITLLLCNTDGDPAKQTKFVKNMLERQADGLILISQSIDSDVAAILGNGPPCVFVNRIPDGDGFDYVGPDNDTGIDLLLEHLTAFGHRRIGYASGPLHSSTARERLGRYRNRIAELGLDDDAHLIFEGDYDAESGRAAADALLMGDEPPTAIMAANDFTALGVIARARQLGFRVPQDLSATGFDDALGASILPEVFPDQHRIVTITQPRRDLGRNAAALLLRRIDEPDAETKRVVLNVRLTVGSTTGPCRAARSPEHANIL